MTSTKARQVLLLVWPLLTVGLAAGPAGAATIHVPSDVPTIQAAINLAAPGDDVLVAPGTYFEHDITMKGGVWLHSELGPDVTTVDAAGLGRGFNCLDITQRATIEGLTVVNGQAVVGGGMACIRSHVAIRRCIVLGCGAEGFGGGIYGEESRLSIDGSSIGGCQAGAGGGVYARPAMITIEDCRVIENAAYASGGGVFAGGPEVRIRTSVITSNDSGGAGGGIACVVCSSLSIVGSAISGNWAGEWGGGSGIHVAYATGEIAECTVVRNSGFGPEDPSIGFLEECQVDIMRTIIAFNRGSALSCDISQISLRCCDSHGNTGGDHLCGTDLGGNFSADPLFCDAANGDYTLDWASPCLPGNHPNGIDCGLIGALGAGCGTPPVTGACCLADDSCVVAEPQDCASQGGSYLGDGTDCEPNPCIPTASQKTTWGKIRAGYR